MKYRIPPKPEYFDSVPPGTCRWCNELTGLTPKGKVKTSRWHSHCLQEYKLLFWPAETRKAVWNRDGGICAICTKQCNKKGGHWHVDHQMPLIEAKGNISFWKMGNLQTLCVNCHKQKTSQEATSRAEQRKKNVIT